MIIKYCRIFLLQLFLILVLIIVASSNDYCEIDRKYCFRRKHIACAKNDFNVPVETWIIKPLNEKMIEFILHELNTFRSNVAIGKYLEEGLSKASNMRLVAWNKEFALLAELLIQKVPYNDFTSCIETDKYENPQPSNIIIYGHFTVEGLLENFIWNQTKKINNVKGGLQQLYNADNNQIGLALGVLIDNNGETKNLLKIIQKESYGKYMGETYKNGDPCSMCSMWDEVCISKDDIYAGLCVSKSRKIIKIEKGKCDELEAISKCKGDKGSKGLNGEMGIVGKPGPTGAKGDTGAKGLPGKFENGTAGQKGEKGNIGLDGLTGEKGRTGAIGPPGKGEKGNPGVDGNKGQIGPIGPPGKKGETGYIGPPGKGEKGNNGTKGEPGLPGLIGLEGSKGNPGIAGLPYKGDRGTIGPKGEKGTEGLPGVLGGKGNPGERGESVKGEKGNSGKTGEKGRIGDSGFPGTKGDMGYIGSPGRGNKGDPGSKGDDGKTGSIGQKGEKGNNGSNPEPCKGEKGTIGQFGTKGTSGNKGEMGFKGLQGTKGEKGDNGIVGPIGEKGSLGRDGTPGTSIKGEFGEKGSTGPKGEKGSVLIIKSSSFQHDVNDMLETTCSCNSPQDIFDFSYSLTFWILYSIMGLGVVFSLILHYINCRKLHPFEHHSMQNLNM